MEEKTNKINNFLVPITIVIAGVVISVAILYSTKVKVQRGGGNLLQPLTANQIKFQQVSSDDHIRGNINAPVKIIEYSDTECPFCKMFHSTLQQIISEYQGQVAWIYRHFPLDSLHPKARKEAEATECAAELGGNEKFWAYIDRLFEITPSNNRLDLAELPKIAEYVGLDVNKFNECLNSGRYANKVQNHLNDAINAGGRGTPYSLIIAPNGKIFPVEGAYPYEMIKQIIDQALKER
jgi:protein-disulfide isomerase